MLKNKRKYPSYYGYRGDTELRGKDFSEEFNLNEAALPIFGDFKNDLLIFRYCIEFDPSMDPNLWDSQDCEDLGTKVNIILQFRDKEYHGYVNFEPDKRKDFSVDRAFDYVSELRDRLEEVYHLTIKNPRSKKFKPKT